MSNIENLPPVPNQPAEMPDQPPVIGHSGELEGNMREVGLDGAQKIEPGIQAPDTVYAGFETRPPEPQERGLMDQAKAAVRDSHNTDLDGYIPRGTQQAHPERKWLIGGGTVAAMGALLWALIANTPQGEAKKTGPENTSSPVTNSSTQPSKQETLTPSAAPSTEKFTPSSEVLQQTTPIEVMEKMTVENFAKLSPADRFAYYKAHAPNALIDTPSSDMSTEHPDYIAGGTWQPIEADALSNHDINVGKKMYLAGLYYTVDKQSGSLNSAAQVSISDVARINGAGANDNYEYISSGEWQHGVDSNGKAIDFINVTAHQIRTIGGAEVPGSLQTYQAIREHIKLLNGEEYIMFFQGYTADGHAAADPKYPY